MSRKVRDTRLETRDARARLKPKHEPYWRQIEPGLFLGYRKGARGGVWFARRLKDGSYKHQRLGKANDYADANGIDVLDYAEAQRLAMGHADSAARIEATGASPEYTVGDALADYMDWYRSHRKGIEQTDATVRAHLLPAFKSRKVADLTAKELRAWQTRLAKGRSKATCNRILTVLKAALNAAWKDGRVPSRDAWTRVTPFRAADGVRTQYLELDDCRRLQNASEPDFRDLVAGALMTGTRYGELCAMRSEDYHADAGTVTVHTSKSGKPRHVPLTDEGRALFDRLTAGKVRHENVFTLSTGEPWARYLQVRRMRGACQRAGIEPAVSFHILRHTYGSLLAMEGVPMQVIAKAMGHADTRMTEKHYAHLAPSHVADVIRAHLPNFGAEKSNVTRLRR
jgi:integrase